MREQEAKNGAARSPWAVRLTFSYEGDEIRLEDQRRVRTIASPTDTLSGYGDERGFWVEVRDGQKETLYRRVMPNPLRKDVEVFSPDHERGIFRAPVERPSGVFAVLVPDLDRSDHVAVMSSAGDEAIAADAYEAKLEEAPDPGRGTTAVEIARFPLRGGGGGSEA